MKMLIFALFIIFNSAFAISRYEIKMTSSQKDSITDLYKKDFIKKTQEDEENATYGDITSLILEAYEELYFSGFVSEDDIADVTKRLNEIKDESIEDLSAGKVKRTLKKIVKDNLSRSKMKCALPGEVAGNRQCCQEDKNDHEKYNKGKKGIEYALDDIYMHKRPMTENDKKRNSEEFDYRRIGGKDVGATCSNHKDCKSKVCKANYNSATMTCQEPISCYKLKKGNIGTDPNTGATIGEECNSHPYCGFTDKGKNCAKCNAEEKYEDKQSCKETNKCSTGDQAYQCLPISHGFSGADECKISGVASSDPSECCSNKVANGKCVNDSKCGLCKNRGDKPDKANNILCCPGLIESLNGKCVSAMPPFILDVSTSFLDKAVDLIQLVIGISSAYADDEPTREEVAREFNISKVNKKEKSDIDECNFNTFNDYWVAADPKLVNSMVVLQAFEVTYSGKGTVDYQTEAGSDGKSKGSIFERSNKISTDFRKLRKSMRNRFDRMDRDLTCKCLHLLGPVNGFSFKKPNVNITLEDGTKKVFGKKEYYTGSYCGGIVGNVDAGTLNGGGMENIDKIDSGAIGISHEKVLIEWLRMRREMEAEAVIDGQDLEDSLYELSEFIDEYPWYADDESSLEPHKLYSFRIRYMTGLAKFIVVFLIVLAVTVLTIVSFGSFAAIGSAVAAGVGAMVAAGTFAASVAIGIAVVVVAVGLVSWGVSAMFKSQFKNANLSPRIVDVRTRHREDRKEKGWKWKGGSWYEYDQYDRKLMYPYYSNASEGGEGDTLCSINGTRFKCLKSAYLLPKAYIMMGALIEAKDYPILDPQIPLTVPYSLYDTEKYGPNKYNYQTLLEEAFQNYKKELKLTYPRKDNGKKRVVEDEHNGTYEVPNGNSEIAWGKKKYLDEPDPSTDPNVIKAYVPNSGPDGWKVENFGESRVAAFKAGVEKYVRCKEMKPKDGQGCLITGQDQVEKGAIGFGYFFEDEQNIKDFVDYMYQLHFSWPNLALNADIAYPKMGQDVYFQLIAGQMATYNELAFENMGKLSKLVELYEKDLASRIANYGALNSSATGTKSIQAKFSDKMWAEFNGLGFSNGVAMTQLSARADKLSKTEGLSATEANFFSAVKSHALRKAKQQAKRDNWNKKIGNTPRGKNILKGTSEFIKKFTNPLGAKGHSFAGAAANSAPVQKKNMPEKDKEVISNTYSPSQPSYTSSYSGGVSSGYEVAESLNKDLTDAQAKYMLEAAKKESNEKADGDSLFIVVSKAYRRNLDRVLVTRVTLDDKVEEKKEEVIDSSEKAELKKLLESH